MSADPLCATDEYLPLGPPRGCILVVSDHRPLNRGHAATLCLQGYAVYTAVTCTDVSRICGRKLEGDLDLVVFASLVHGWHHREGEGRPWTIPQTTDPEWQTRNMREAIDIVCGRQESTPMVLIAVELMTCGWYNITADALATAGIEYQTYSASNPHAIVDVLR